MKRCSEFNAHLFDKLPDFDVSQFVILKGNNAFIRWDFTQQYLNDIVEKIILTINPQQVKR